MVIKKQPESVKSAIWDVIDEVILPKIKQTDSNLKEVAKDLLLTKNEVADFVDQYKIETNQKIQENIDDITEQISETKKAHKDYCKVLEADLKSLKKDLLKSANLKDVADKLNFISKRISAIEKQNIFEYNDSEIKEKCENLKAKFEILENQIKESISSDEIVKDINKKTEIINASAIKGLVQTLQQIANTNQVNISPSILEVFNNGTNVLQGVTRLNFIGGTITKEGNTVNITITGGGGSSTYAALTDAATVNLPSINTPLATALNLKEDKINKGVANGYAGLDGTGKVPANQLPSYVDDVIEVANFAALPVTGETGKIYITLDNNKTFRWTGSIYVEVSPNTPAGTNGQVQFNDNGAPGADANFNWDNVNKRLSVKKLTNTIIGDAATYGIIVESGATSGALALGVDANYSYLQSFNSKPLWINPAGNNIILGGVGVTVGINNITATNGNTLAVNGKAWVNNQLFLGNTQAAPYATFYATSNGAQIDTRISGVGNGRMIFSVNNVEKSRMDSDGNWGYLTNAPTHTQTHSSVSNGIALYNTADQTTNFEIARHFWTINQYVIQTSQGGTGIARDINVNSSLFKANGRFNVQGVTSNYIGALQSSPGDATLFVYRSSGEGIAPTTPGTVAQFGSNSGPGFSSSIGIISGTAGNASLNFGDKDSDNSGVLQFSNATNTFALNREISLSFNKIVNLATPTIGTDATNKSYVDNQISLSVAGLLDDRGNYNASTNLFPAAGGSGGAGAVLKGDLWTVNVAGTLEGVAVTVGDVVRALVDSPAQIATNWAITENNIGYVAENSVNKATSFTTINNTLYPTVQAVNTEMDTRDATQAVIIASKVQSITAGTNVTIGGTATNPIINATGGGGGGSITVNSIEIDFGTKPVTSKSFIVTDAAIISTSKILVYADGAPATGRADGDFEWDSINFVAKANAGTFTIYANSNSFIEGKRKLFYSSA